MSTLLLALRNQALLVLMMAHFTNDLFGGILPMYLPVMKERFELSNAAIGFAILAYSGMSSLSQPLFGYFSDRGGRRWYLAATLVWSAGFIALYGFAPNYPVFLLLAGLAGIGSGAFTGKSLSSATRMSVSTVDRLSDASLSYSSLWGWHDLGREEAFLGLTRDVWRTRGFGDFWSYMLVAEGAVDVATEPAVALHDLAAPCIVVTEAGGRFTDLAGTPGPSGGSAVATNGLLHAEVLRRLSG